MRAVETAGANALVGLKRSELGDVFRGGSTSIPDGRGRGTVLIGTGGAPARAIAVLTYALAWRGKVVDAKAGRLKNLMSPLGVPAIAAQVYEDASWYDGEPCVVLDYSRTSWVARRIRDEIREVSPGVFLGLVFVGRRLVLNFALEFAGRGQPH
jgi:hypothetical protein